MEEKLREKGPELVNKIQPSSLFWEVLYRERVIEDIEEFTLEGTRADRVSRLLQHVRHGQENIHYHGLLMALIETNQVAIVSSILNENASDYINHDTVNNDGHSLGLRERLAQLLSQSSMRQSRIKRCPWDQHKLLEVDEVFQPLVLQMREMTNMGVEKTFGSMIALFNSTESLDAEMEELTLPLHDILQEGTRICVNGPRGSGKTTLLTKIAKDYEGVAQECDLIFHIDCEQLKQNEDIASYIKRSNLPYLKSHEEQALNQLLWKTSDGMFMLFLLDNVDCLKMPSGDLANTNIKNLLSGKSFSYARVIATSRSQCYNNQAPRDVVFDKHINIKGFSKESLCNYIKCFYDNTEGEPGETTHDQLVRLTEDPKVFNLLRYPLHINFFLFAARDNKINGKTELYTHVLRAILSQARGHVQALNKAIKMLYNKKELRMELLAELGFVRAAGEVAYVNLMGDDFDADDENFNEDHQTAVDLGLLTMTTTDRDQTCTNIIRVQHQELTEYLATVYLASLTTVPNNNTLQDKRRRPGIKGKVFRHSITIGTDELTNKVKQLRNRTKDSSDPLAILDILVFSASISIELFHVVVKCCVADVKDDCYEDLRATREWHVMVRNDKFQTMKSIMDAFFAAYTETPNAWKERAGHVFRILTNKSFIIFVTKHNIQMAIDVMESLNVKFFSNIKGLLLVYKSGHGFSILLQHLLRKAHNLKYLHILFYLDFPTSFPKDFSDFKSVSLPAGEKVYLDLILHGGQKVIDLYGIPLHNISTQSLSKVHNIHSLCLREAKLTENDGAALAEVIKGQPRLEVLNLHNNPALRQGLRPVIGVLSYNQRLKTLDLSRTGLSLECWCDLQQIFPKLKQLQFIELSMNSKLGPAAEESWPKFDTIKNLKEIHLRDCELNQVTLNLCLVSLLQAKSLRVLDILDNNLDLQDEECQLMSFIHCSLKLQYLFIHGNDFSQEWLSDLVVTRRHLKVDAEYDPERHYWETRFVTEVCVAKSIQSAPSHLTLGHYFPDDGEEEDEDGEYAGHNSS